MPSLAREGQAAAPGGLARHVAGHQQRLPAGGQAVKERPQVPAGAGPGPAAGSPRTSRPGPPGRAAARPTRASRPPENVPASRLPGPPRPSRATAAVTASASWGLEYLVGDLKCREAALVVQPAADAGFFVVQAVGQPFHTGTPA